MTSLPSRGWRILPECPRPGGDDPQAEQSVGDGVGDHAAHHAARAQGHEVVRRARRHARHDEVVFESEQYRHGDERCRMEPRQRHGAEVAALKVAQQERPPEEFFGEGHQQRRPDEADGEQGGSARVAPCLVREGGGFAHACPRHVQRQPCREDGHPHHDGEGQSAQVGLREPEFGAAGQAHRQHKAHTQGLDRVQPACEVAVGGKRGGGDAEHGGRFDHEDEGHVRREGRHPPRDGGYGGGGGLACTRGGVSPCGIREPGRFAGTGGPVGVRGRVVRRVGWGFFGHARADGVTRAAGGGVSGHRGVCMGCASGAGSRGHALRVARCVSWRVRGRVR